MGRTQNEKIWLREGEALKKRNQETADNAGSFEKVGGVVGNGEKRTLRSSRKYNGEPKKGGTFRRRVGRK